MIQIGINENVILKNVELVDKDGKLSIDFSLAEAGQEVSADDDPFNDVIDEETGMIVTGSGKGGRVIKVWPLTPPNEVDFNGAAKTVAVRIQEAMEATREMQNLFNAFAMCYVTADKRKFDRFQGIQIGVENRAMILEEAVLLQVTRNLASQFIAMCSPFFGNQDYKLRILLRRQSAAKPFPTFRDRLIQAFPFVELGDLVSKEASKIAFTKYEISKKLNSDAPAEADEDTAAEAVVPKDAASLFGAAKVDMSTDQAMNS